MAIHLSEEEKDAIILEEINRVKKRKKQFQAWNEGPLLLRRQVVMDMLGKGMSRAHTVREIMARWNVCVTTANAYVNDVNKYIAESYKEDTNSLREVIFHKLEALAEDAIANRDRKSALKAYEQMSKLGGLYEDKVKVEADTTITFDFGGND